jgi:hypothetical protein
VSSMQLAIGSSFNRLPYMHALSKASYLAVYSLLGMLVSVVIEIQDCGMLQASAEKGAQIVVLPEMWNCPYSNDSFATYAEDIKGGSSKSFATMQSLAKDLSVVLIGGSIPEKDGDKLYNTSCIFDSDGSLLGCYRY